MTKTPSVDTLGTYDVTIVATDEGGNTREVDRKA